MNKANSKLIGAFVFGAVLLFMGAMFLFGSRDIFKERNCFVAYFEQSINGLNVGDPVKFRGIEVGYVAALEGVYDPETSIVLPKVLLEFEPEALKNAKAETGKGTIFISLVDRGMRASLKSQSLVTGQLYVSLDFHPDNKARYLSNGTDKWPEMPTIDSGLGELFSALEGLPLDELVTQITSTLTSIEQVVSNQGISRSADYLPTLLATVNSTIGSIGNFTETDLLETTGQIRTTLANSDQSISQLTDKLTNETLVVLNESMRSLTKTLTEETLVELNTSMQKFEDVMEQLELTLETAQSRLDPADPLTYELTNTMREVARMSSSVKSLTDFLEAHPESLLRGR